MTLFGLIVTLLLMGLFLWILSKVTFIDGTIKEIIKWLLVIIAVAVTVLFLLRLFGVNLHQGDLRLYTDYYVNAARSSLC
jgi:hypothetical protein